MAANKPGDRDGFYARLMEWLNKNPTRLVTKIEVAKQFKCEKQRSASALSYLRRTNRVYAHKDKASNGYTQYAVEIPEEDRGTIGHARGASQPMIDEHGEYTHRPSGTAILKQFAQVQQQAGALQRSLANLEDLVSAAVAMDEEAAQQLKKIQRVLGLK